MSRLSGTSLSSPPEVTEATKLTRLHAKKIDLWHLGIVFYRLWCGQAPTRAFFHKKNRVFKGTPQPEYIHHMLAIDPQRRPAMEQVVAMVRKEHDARREKIRA